MRWRIVGRTLRRAVRRTELWNGCREAPLRTILNDPDHIVRWAIRTHLEHAPRVRALAEQRPELPIVWLSSRRELKKWTGALTAWPPCADGSGRFTVAETAWRPAQGNTCLMSAWILVSRCVASTSERFCARQISSIASQPCANCVLRTCLTDSSLGPKSMSRMPAAAQTSSARQTSTASLSARRTVRAMTLRIRTSTTAWLLLTAVGRLAMRKSN